MDLRIVAFDVNNWYNIKIHDSNYSLNINAYCIILSLDFLNALFMVDEAQNYDIDVF